MICPYCSNNADQISPVWFKCVSCKQFFENESHKEEFLGVTNTSRKSYKQVKEDGLEATQESEILDYITEHPDICIREVSEGLNLQKSSVSARMNKLKAEGKIIQSGLKSYKNKTVEMWR